MAGLSSRRAGSFSCRAGPNAGEQLELQPLPDLKDDRLRDAPEPSDPSPSLACRPAMGPRVSRMSGMTGIRCRGHSGSLAGWHAGMPAGLDLAPLWFRCCADPDPLMSPNPFAKVRSHAALRGLVPALIHPSAIWTSFEENDDHGQADDHVLLDRRSYLRSWNQCAIPSFLRL